MLGVGATLLSFVLPAFPSWARSIRHAMDQHTLRRRALQLERRIVQLRDAEWQAIELRAHRDQFVASRKQLLGSIFRYYRAAGQCTAHRKNTPRIAAA